MELIKLRRKIEQAKGEKKSKERDLAVRNKTIKVLRKKLDVVEKSQIIIQVVAKQTQDELTYHISELSSLALSSVFPNPYELDVDFQLKRRKTECHLNFKRNGRLYDPKTEAGHGTCNIGAFGLRAALLKLKANKVRSILFLDEPLPGLKGKKTNLRALKMLKRICNEIGLQIIMVGDERVKRKDIIKVADRVIETTINNGITQMEVL